MRRRVALVVTTVISTLFLPSLLAAQSPQTPNTLGLDDAAARPRATLRDLELLVGHWKGGFLGSTAEEVWLPAAGGSMLGSARVYKETEVVFYEIMIAVEEQGSVSLRLKHFHPDLRGWEERDETVTFRFVKGSKTEIYFEGLTFRKQEDGSLQGFVAIRRKDGSVREEPFTYQPVRAR